jgi:hypothetical protein
MPKLPEGVIVAAIAASSAVAGTLAGSLVTYAGNKALQNRQVEQEATRQQAAARAVVRLLMSEYRKDGKQLEDMTGAGAYDTYSFNERTFVSKIGQEDRKLLAGNLSEKEWTAVSEAANALEAVAANVEVHRGKGRLGSVEVGIFDGTEKLCEQAYSAVTPFAEGKAA